MKMTTLCYLEKDEKYLMLHRTKKVNDENHDKWIGVGGKFEDREILEETGLTVTDFRYRGVVTFVSDQYPTEYMHLFTVTDWTGVEKECDEGELAWIEKKKLLTLPMWEGDRIFLELIAEESTPFFSLKLTYLGDKLTEAVMDGKKIKI